MELVRYVLPHLAAGCLGGLTAAGGIVASNFQALGELMLRTPGGGLAAALLAGSFVLTFASAAAGWAIMRIGEDDD